jgi:hypothetical protein
MRWVHRYRKACTSSIAVFYGNVLTTLSRLAGVLRT